MRFQVENCLFSAYHNITTHHELFIFHSIHMDDFILFGHQCGSEELTLVAIYFHISVNSRSPGRLVSWSK